MSKFELVLRIPSLNKGSCPVCLDPDTYIGNFQCKKHKTCIACAVGSIRADIETCSLCREIVPPESMALLRALDPLTEYTPFEIRQIDDKKSKHVLSSIEKIPRNFELSSSKVLIMRFDGECMGILPSCQSASLSSCQFASIRESIINGPRQLTRKELQAKNTIINDEITLLRGEYHELQENFADTIALLGFSRHENLRLREEIHRIRAENQRLQTDLNKEKTENDVFRSMYE